MGYKPSKIANISSSSSGSSKKFKMQINENEKSRLFEFVNQNIIGKDANFNGPFGKKMVTYCDFVASGKSLKFIEDYIRNYVLPFYSNTHTTTSICSKQMSIFRNESRQIIKACVNANEKDVCIFSGNGATGAIHKLVGSLEVKNKAGKISVIVGPYEHHSNILPWKEAGAVLVRVKQNNQGLVDLNDLDVCLSSASIEYEIVIATFSACSNITGIIVDTKTISDLVHKYNNAFVVFDYACGAPYLNINMNLNNFSYIDAIVCSPHKFIGGAQTPGILIAKKHLFKNKVHHASGGGTVFYVTSESYGYLEDIEEREGGTPGIVESIRAGLVFQLKDILNVNEIMIKDFYNNLARNI